MNLTDDELIKELFKRAMESDLFCIRLMKACFEFLDRTR